MFTDGALTKYRWIGAVVVVLLVVMAGMVGGMISHRLDTASIRAQNTQFASDLVLPDGGLFFKTKTGKIAAKVDADEGGGFLMIYNTSEKPAIVMGGSPYGGGGLIDLTNGKGAGAALQLAVLEEGGSVRIFSQKRGKRVVELFAEDDGGYLAVNGPAGDPAVTIATTESGRKVSGKIDVLENSGKVVWSAPGNHRRRAP